MKVLASLLPFLASTENEGENDGQEDCVMMIDVVNGEKLCVKNPEMGVMDDFFRSNLLLAPFCWVFWVGPQTNFEFTVALNITTPKYTGANHGQAVDDIYENLPCANDLATVVVTTEHKQSMFPGDVLHYQKKYVGVGSKGAELPEEGAKKTLASGCHNSMPINVVAPSQSYITVMYDGASQDAIFSSGNWSISYELDRNECTEYGFDGCTGNARCVNFIGSYTCECIPPYIGIPEAEACINPQAYQTLALFESLIEEAEARIDALDVGWAEALDFFNKTNIETNALLQQSLDDLTAQEEYLYYYRQNVTAVIAEGDAEVANRTDILNDLEERIEILTENFGTSVDYFIESFQSKFQENQAKTDLANEVNMETYNAYLGIVVAKSNEFQMVYNSKMAQIDSLTAQIQLDSANSRFYARNDLDAIVAGFEEEITLQKSSAVNELADAVNLISPVQADLDLAEAHSLARLGYFEGLRESFFAWRNAPEIPNSQGKVIQFNNIVSNNGGFAASGREFSAPYKGEYFFTLTAQHDQAAPFQVTVYVNGIPSSMHSGSPLQININSFSRPSNDLLQTSGVLSLNAHDKVAVRLHANNIPETGLGTVAFSGYLIDTAYSFQTDLDEPAFGRLYGAGRSFGFNKPLSKKIKTSGFRLDFSFGK
ncbi:Oidioi.mRNA.OKI2018_I69.PAR.g9146.t1.cds [Oikopleura dioica]|uniref:Oidioi.mRNA.OKI2018_I69.PAR.g9146.t1.cds n=1 Tax=Oikopleura dioica TaxID=34765 RepID=A0ABN7RRT0_OIKDI|nr:Oidioi.mRNA.OKI2018_I69.PAR.g9146.t1.cds [Oikopleura dioica]